MIHKHDQYFILTVSKGIRNSYCNKVTYSTISFLAVYIVNIDKSFCCLESKLIVYSYLYHQFLPINTR